MSESPEEKYELTEADFEMLTEDITGKPVKPANLAAGIASMRQRIAELEESKAKLLNQMDDKTDGFDALAEAALKSLNKDLAAARDRLDSYLRQVKMQN